MTRSRARLSLDHGLVREGPRTNCYSTSRTQQTLLLLNIDVMSVWRLGNHTCADRCALSSKFRHVCTALKPSKLLRFCTSTDANLNPCQQATWAYDTTLNALRAAISKPTSSFQAPGSHCGWSRSAGLRSDAKARHLRNKSVRHTHALLSGSREPLKTCSALPAGGRLLAHGCGFEPVLATSTAPAAASRVGEARRRG